jgi:exopolyphosphatase/guanosine-5'-triphosphate,3'-diphosphate pyrophosphatase
LVAAAGTVLEELAGLVRQTGEPAASHIVDRVPSDPAVEPEPEPEPAPEPLVEPDEPEPEPEAVEPEAIEPSPEPEPVEPDTVEPAAARIEIAAGAVIGAAIDVGSTSVHLLVAAVGGHSVEPLLDESVFLGLGDRVAADGHLGSEAREELVASLVAYADTARQLGAERITIVGTEPLRRADDTAAVVSAVEARARVPLHVVDHDEEGLLTLLGVTKGRPIETNLLVVDIGGGSSEFVVVSAAGEVHATGLPLGAARLTRDLVRGDPPTLADLEAVRVRVREILADAPAIHPGDVVAVGGTAANLLRLLPATTLDHVLTRRRLTVALAMLTVERSLEAAERHLVRPARARILPAGAIIVDAILEHYAAERLTVSEEGIREGLVIAAAAAGPAWRDRIRVLVRGWSEEDWPIE